MTVNISSPNTQNLRTLQSDAALDALLAALAARRAELADEHGRRVPMFVKIAPDLDAAQIEAIAAIVCAATAIDGVIATNTTLARDGVAGHAHAGESGGLSGAPLARAIERGHRAVCAPRSARAFRSSASAASCRAPMRAPSVEAGADLVQIYTGFIYQRPGAGDGSRARARRRLTRRCAARSCRRAMRDDKHRHRAVDSATWLQSRAARRRRARAGGLRRRCR